MKITLDIIKSRLRMIRDIESACIYCKFEADGKTINLNETIAIFFSVEYFSTNEKEKEANEIKYEEIAKTWKEAIFGKKTNVIVGVLDFYINEDIGNCKKINLIREPDLIVTKEDLAERLRDIGGIDEAWVICEAGNSEEYINYEYDMGIYFKLSDDVEEENVMRQIREKLFILFGSRGKLYEVVCLDKDEMNIRYKCLDRSLEEMTKIL